MKNKKHKWKTNGESAQIRIGMICAEINFDGREYILDCNILPLNQRLDSKNIEIAKKLAVDHIRMRIVEILNDIFLVGTI